MPDPKLTPEEKLLRFIESPNKTMGRGRGQPPLRKPRDLKLSLQLFKTKYKEKLLRLLSLKTINSLLALLAAIATVFLGLDFWLGLPRGADIQRLEVEAKNLNIGDATIEHIGPLSDYLHDITQRNIFALAGSLEAEDTEEAKITKELMSLQDSFKVVGIIWSEAPQAIIEDVADGTTHLLNRGGKLKKARVKEIVKDRVILSYDKQEVELK